MARKSRKNFSQANSSYNMTSLAASEVMKKPKYYKVGIYARLSFESEMNKERDTVDTQISFIKDYIARQDDMEIYDVYADISLTGTNFNRPEFNRMIEDIKSGKINTIITKDLSRLGRNYIESGTYIERIFPMFNVRYIAITDDFDSIRPDADITMPLKNIVNEYYSKDLSDKVWTAFRSIWKSGLYVCGRPPYGYKKNREKKCLEIDEYAAQVVKRIFSMYLNGMKLAEIARTLKNEGILSPSQYRYSNIGDKEKFDKAKDWYYVQVKDILKDQQYVGDSVHGKSGGKLGEHRTKRTAAGMLEHLQAYKRQRSSCVELQKEIDKLHQMKSKAEAKKFQLYDDYTKGIVQRDIMVSERTTLTERIGEIEIELHELESKIQLEQCINKAGEEETIELLSKMERFDLELIRQVVKRITMYDDGNIQFEWNVDDFIQVK